MVRKVTRIFFKTIGMSLLLLILVVIGLYFGIQSYTFQTWLGKRASDYLSNELKSKVFVEKVNLEFFSIVDLKGICILDQHNDTLLDGDIHIRIKTFDYENRKLILETTALKDVTSKLIKYKNDSTLNYQFLVDYFNNGKKDTSKTRSWDLKFGDVILDNVNFVYRDEKFVAKKLSTINFNDINLKKTYGRILGFRLDVDTIYLQIKDFSTKEQCGFELNKLSTEAKISGQNLLCDDLYLKTPKTLVKGKIDFSYNQWDDYSDFLNKVKINSRLDDSTQVSFEDIAYFTSELKGLNKTIQISGEVQGYVSDLRLSKFKLAYGQHTRLNGYLTLSGLPDVNTTYLHIDAKELATSYSDITEFPNYPFSEGKKIELPLELKRLGKISYQGKFDGFMTDFTTHGKFNTDLGKVNAQLSIKMGKNISDITYHGKLSTINFNLGTLIGQRDLNSLSMNSEVKGKGVTIKDIDAEFEGEILNVTYNKYNYKNVKLNGSFSDKLFSGLLVCQDPNANFDFNGTVNFRNRVPEMDFISTLNNINLNRLNFTNASDSGSLSSQILINIKGNNLDDLSGQVNFDNTIYKTKTRIFKLSTFNIETEQIADEKKIKLNSAYFNAIVGGRYKISNLQPAMELMLYSYYPDFFTKPKSTKKFTDEIDFKVTIKKFNTINELFIPSLMLSPGSDMEGSFKALENKLTLRLVSSKIDYNSVHLKNFTFNVSEADTHVYVIGACKSLTIGDSLNFDNFNLNVGSINRDANYSLNWDNLKKPLFKGEIVGRLNYSKSILNLLNDKIAITVNDSIWNMINPNKITIDSNANITLNPLIIRNHVQSVNITGTYSDKLNDSLVINTSSLIIEQFNPLLKLLKIRAEGIMNGNMSLTNEQNNFTFNGYLNLSKLKINDNVIGELVANTNYNTHDKNIKLNGYTSLGIEDEFGNQTKNISFNGTYYLDKKEESLDINFAARPANLRLLNPILEGILTIKSGFVTGEGKIHGTPDKIMIDGKMKLYNSEIKVDYTNVTYNITGDIEIMPDQIRFSDLMMREKGSKSVPQGTINGNIFHSNFSRMQLDYDVSYKNMLVLNTTARENKTFYGKVYGTGNVGIYGFLNNLNMKVTDTTTKNSRFFLPLDGPTEIEDNDFIHFVKKDTNAITKNENELSGFNLDLSIYATPEAQAQIILDQQNGDVLNVNGEGDLKLKINTLGKFEMIGDYVITDGDYLFTLENVINKKFEIVSGSSISWSGDPLNAEIKIITNYKQRASVAPLLNDTTAKYKGRVPVDCKLLISGKLLTPDINFVVDFPTLDATERASINNVLSDEVELNRQVFSFLLFRSFLTPQIFNSGGGVIAGGAAASTGSEMLSNRLSGFLNSYFGNLTGIRDLQLGLNYRAGGLASGDAVDLALSKQFLNNKITVDGNFGVNNQSRSSNGLIGDVNIDYKLSNDGRYRLKGFNKSNDNAQIAIVGGQYTQGIGFFYREEFETFNQLFSRYLKKIKKK